MAAASDALYKYGMTTMFVLGVIGNSLALFIFLKVNIILIKSPLFLTFLMLLLFCRHCEIYTEVLLDVSECHTVF